MGHPCEVIVHISNHITHYLPEPLSGHQINRNWSLVGLFYDSIRLPDTHTVPLDSNSIFDGTDTAINRDTFLRSLCLLSILVRWRHNRYNIARELGLDFSQKLVVIINLFSSKIDDVSLLWQSSFDIDDIIPTALLEDILFIIRCILLGIYIIVYSCPNVKDVSACAKTFLPPQPWDLKVLESFGFRVLEFTLNGSPDMDSKSYNSDSIYLKYTTPIHAMSEMEPWIHHLLNCGVVSSLTTLLRKIQNFVMLLKQSNLQLKQISLLKMLQKECLILQNETLFALIVLFSLDSKKTCPAFLESSGCDILNTVVTQTCCNSNSGLHVYQTGILSLTLNEILNSYLSFNFDVNSVDNRTTVIQHDALCSLFEWIMQSFVTEQECNADLLANFERYDSANVVIAGIQSKNIPVMNQFHSDLWPWFDNPSQAHEFVSSSVPLVDGVGSMNYRLCHSCYDDTQFDLSTKSFTQECPNILAALSLALNQPETQTPLHSHNSWLFRGKSAFAIRRIFDVLLATSVGKNYLLDSSSHDARRSHITKNVNVIMKSIFSVLNSRQNLVPPNSWIPLFEAHFLLFLGRCLHIAPVNLIEAFCEGCDIWSMIFTSKLLLGGREVIRRLIQLNLSSDFHNIHSNFPVKLSDTFTETHFLDPILRCCSSRDKSHRSYHEETLTGIFGFTWIYVHDLSLDLASIITSIINHPPTNKIVSLKRHFDIKPIIHALQESSENGDDSITYQLLKWMSGYINLLSNRGSAFRNSLSGQFFRAALAVCGYHLGDIRASAILQKEHTTDPILLANKERLFMWISRRAAVELVIQVLGYSSCDRWLRLFATSKNNEKSSTVQAFSGDSRSTNLKQAKSPAHVTLMLLFVDVRLRLPLSYIMSKVLFKLMTEKMESESEIPIQTGIDYHYAKSYADLIVDDQLGQIADGRTGLYDKCINELLLDLFELVKWSSRQPDWYKGNEVAASILLGITQMIRSQKTPSIMRELQQWFRRGGIMLELINSLYSCLQHGEYWNDASRTQIIHIGLTCLTSLMSGDPKNKLEFRALMMSKRASKSLFSSNSSQSSKQKKSTKLGIQYDDFIEMIVKGHNRTVLLETLLILFEMILDGPVNSACLLNDRSSYVDLFSEINFPQIANVPAIPILFGVMNAAAPDIQTLVINSFISLISGRSSLVNLSKCFQINPSVLDLTLDYFSTLSESVQLVCVKLLQILGQHSISVAQLKRIFQLMRTHGEFRPTYSTFLLHSLQGMLEDNERPRHCFVFDGIESGIQIPLISRWPAQTAFTISLWVSVGSSQEFRTGKASLLTEYRPYILSMRCSNGNGFDIFLKQAGLSKYRICIRCFGCTPDGELFLVPPKLSLVEGHWHYLAISLKSSSFRNHSEIEVMLDDQFIRHRISFPKFNDIIPQPLIGCCPERYRESGVNSTLSGQMSAFFLFADALTEGQLRGIYGLGPSYFYSFESYAVVHRNIVPFSRRQTVDPILSVLDGSLSSLILLAYNPAVWRGDFYLDNTPEKNQIRWKPSNILSPSLFDFDKDQMDSLINKYSGKMHARSLPGTYRSSTSDIRTAINSLGGVRVLFPLFAQFDQPRVKIIPQGLNCNSVEVLTDVDTDISVTLLDLLRSFFGRTSENETLLKEFQGFSIIGFFFERMSPQHLTLQTLDMILKIRDSVSWNSHFSDDVLDHLLLNFKIWKFASFSVQSKLFEVIKGILLTLDGKVIQSRNITKRIIDALYLLYDYEAPLEIAFLFQSKDQGLDCPPSSDIFLHDVAESIYLADRWVHASSGRVEGNKLNSAELRLVRSFMLKILLAIFFRGNGSLIVPDDISSLLNYAVLTSSLASKREILCLLLYLVNDHVSSRSSCIPQVLSGLGTSNGLLSLLPLVSQPDIHVKMFILILFCQCLRFEALSTKFSDKQNGVSDSELRDNEHFSSVLSATTPVEDHSPEFNSKTDSAEILFICSLPISSLVGIINYIQKEILLSLSTNGTLENPLLMPAQILLEILLLSFLGESCSHLIPCVMRLEMNDDQDLYGFCPPLDGDIDKVSSLEPTICIPAFLPALLGILRHRFVPVSLRLSTMVNLRTYILHSNENCDSILSIPAWQDYFLQLIVDETIYLDQLDQTSDQNFSKYIVKSKALVDTCLRTLCDIQFTAVRIGKPVAPRYFISRISRYPQLTVDRIFKEMKLGERKLGVTVLQETISFLRLYHQKDDLNVLQIGFDLLQQTVSALQRESDILLSQKQGFSIPEDDNMKSYLQNILYLNIWLVGAVVLEFMTLPLGIGTVTGTSTYHLDEMDHVRHIQNELCSIEGQELTLWSLVESLLRLMGPMSNINLFHGYWETRDAFDEVEYFTAQETFAFFDPLINEFVSKPIGPTPPSNSKNLTPLLQAAEGVCAIMIRVLFSVFVLGEKFENAMSISALSEIKALISFMCDQNFVNLGLDLNLLISRLSTILHNTTLSLRNEWIQGALNLLIDLILIQREQLISLLRVYICDLTPTIPGGQTRSIIYVKLLEKYSGKLQELSFPVILLDAIQMTLDISELLTWEMWSSLMAMIFKEANTAENERRKDKLTDLGLHKHSEDVRMQLESFRSKENQFLQEVFNQALLAHDSLRDRTIKTLSEQLRSDALNQRKIKLRWNQIVSQLANERGPWGYPENASEIFWKLDQTESNLRTSQVLRRNEAGTSHEIATYLTKRGKPEMSSSDLGLDDSPSGYQKNTPRSGSVNSYISPQGLWRDLLKYQKQSLSSGDNQVDTTDRIEIEENDEDSKETDTKKVLFRALVEVITKSTNSARGGTQGVLELSKNRLSFTRTCEDTNLVNKTGNTDFLWVCENFPSSIWQPEEIWNMLFRKYQMRNVALEIFFTSRQVVFFNFFEPSAQRLFYDIVRRYVKPPYLQPHYGYRPESIIANTIHLPSSRTMTQAWVNRNISNFEYIMFLNTISGRSFNDMSQYPVFPWVVADYISPKLTLTDPRSFRDLRWPMGAQQENQRELFIQRYQDLAETYYAEIEDKKHSLDANGQYLQSDCFPPFHYGSHYSTMGFVLWYLIRQEPFTSLNIWMQDGKFDKPDRIFDTIESCWRGCTSNQADVKELIPEFFYNSDFLENTNRLNLGVTSSNKILGAVGLPPWAKNSQDFIRQNRNALESEYVSSNLHHWIDLIFGYKQRPPHMGGSEAAVESCNVYFHLTYAGAVDLDNLKMHDVRLYNQMVRQIDNYGQTPSELFNRPHPARKPLDEVDLFWPIASQILGMDTLPKGAKVPERPRRLVCFKEIKVSMCPIVFIGEINSWEKLITVDTSRIIATHFWQIRPPDVVPPFQFKLDVHALKGNQGSLSTGFDIPGLRYSSNFKEKRVGVPFAPEQLLRSDYVSDFSGRKLKLHLNNKLIYEKEEAARSNWKIRSPIQSPRRTKQTQNGSSHMEPDSETSTILRVDEYISSHLFAILPDYRFLFSCGHWDNSFKVTQLDSSRLLQSISHHRDVVTCLDLAVDFGLIWLITGSRDCTLIIWQINPLLEKPILQPPLHVLYGHDDCINCVSVSPQLDIVVSGSDDGTIIIHKLREGLYIRSIIVSPPTIPHDSSSKPRETVGDSSQGLNGPLFRSLLPRRIHFLVVSSEGYIVAYSNDDSALYSYTVNGHFQARKMIGDRLHVLRLSEDERVILTGGERGLLVMRFVHSLELSNVGSKFDFEAIIDGSGHDDNDQKPFASPIRSIYLTKQERHLIVGLENGEIRIIAQVKLFLPQTYLSLGFRLPSEKVASQIDGNWNSRKDGK